MRLPIRINLHRNKAISVRPLFWRAQLLGLLFSRESRSSLHQLYYCVACRGARNFREIPLRLFRKRSPFFISRCCLLTYDSGGLRL